MTKTYPKYRSSGVSWLGNIPEHWSVIQLRHLLDIKNGKDHKEVESEDGYPVYGSGGHFAFATEYLYDGESVLLGRKGTIDRPLHVNGKFWTVDTMYWSKIKTGFSGRFAYYASTAIPFTYYSTSTTVPSMTQTALNGHSVAVPKLDEQKDIANYLDKKTTQIDELILKKNQFIERLKEKRTALISQVVTKGLPPDEAKKHGLPENPKMKPSGVDWLGDIPSHWTMKRVKHISTLYGRIGFRGYTVDDLVDEMEGAITLSPGNMINGKFVFEKTTYISWEKYHESPEIKIHPDDILMVKTGSSFGKIAQIREVHHPMTINPQLIVFKEIKIFPRFFFYYLISPVLQGQVSLSNTGGTIPTMTQANIGNYAVPFPTSMDEQLKVANYLDQETSRIDDLIEKVESAIERLNEYRSAIISSAVTGKIDVRGLNQ